jgi:hypothetical protein
MKFGTVKTILYIRAQVISPLQFLHFISFWIKFGVGVHKNVECEFLNIDAVRKAALRDVNECISVFAILLT